MKSKPSFVAYLATLVIASGTIVQATSITVDTVGVINPNAKTILEATGNSSTVSTFTSDITTAFANNTGGVWNFDGAGFFVDNGETITLNYGTSLANSLSLTLSGNQINQGNVSGESTSGAATMLGFSGDASTRTFISSVPLLSIGIISTDRGDAGRIPALTVTFQDTTTASTSGANGDNYFFHSISGTISNPIVSFSLSQNAFIRYDDFGFITAVPEPASAASLAGLLAIGCVALRRRRARS